MSSLPQIHSVNLLNSNVLKYLLCSSSGCAEELLINHSMQTMCVRGADLTMCGGCRLCVGGADCGLCVCVGGGGGGADCGLCGGDAYCGLCGGDAYCGLCGGDAYCGLCVGGA